MKLYLSITFLFIFFNFASAIAQVEDSCSDFENFIDENGKNTKISLKFCNSNSKLNPYFKIRNNNDLDTKFEYQIYFKNYKSLQAEVIIHHNEEVKINFENQFKDYVQEILDWKLNHISYRECGGFKKNKKK
jgi:hypothetical protein